MWNNKIIEQPINIDNSILNNLKFIRICLENCETFDVKVEDIVSINFAKSNKEVKSCLYDGELIISKNAFNVLSSFYDDCDGRIKNKYDIADLKSYELIYRLNTYHDICGIDLYYTNGEIITIFVECCPLEFYSPDNILEESNCNSSVIDKNGNLVLAFGTLSLMPKRIDNNYYDIAPFIKKYIKNPKNNVIFIKIDSISTEREGQSKDILLEANIVNFGKVYLAMRFKDITEFSMRVNNDIKGNHALSMSKIIDGRICVQIGNIFNFFCEEITEEYDDF